VAITVYGVVVLEIGPLPDQCARGARFLEEVCVRHLFQPAAVREVKERLANLRAESAPSWGLMRPEQMLAHCSLSFQMAMGEIAPPRRIIGLIFGRMAKRSLIDRAEPMRRLAPTARSLIVTDARDFVAERGRLYEMIDRFVAGGPPCVTTRPHFFMGPMTPVEWAALMYQHLDHHLRQFDL
jgi:hypothetical protein